MDLHDNPVVEGILMLAFFAAFAIPYSYWYFITRIRNTPKEETPKKAMCPACWKELVEGKCTCGWERP